MSHLNLIFVFRRALAGVISSTPHSSERVFRHCLFGLNKVPVRAFFSLTAELGGVVEIHPLS